VAWSEDFLKGVSSLCEKTLTPRSSTETGVGMFGTPWGELFAVSEACSHTFYADPHGMAIEESR